MVYTWKHRSYGTDDDGGQVRVKKEPKTTMVTVTQWNWWCNTNGVNHYLWCKCFIIVKQILYLIKEMKRANPLLVNSGMQWCKKMYCHSHATKRNTYSKTKLRKVNIAFFKVLFKIIWLPIIFDKNDFRFQIFQSKLTSFLVITILDRGYNFFM